MSKKQRGYSAGPGMPPADDKRMIAALMNEAYHEAMARDEEAIADAVARETCACGRTEEQHD